MRESQLTGEMPKILNAIRGEPLARKTREAGISGIAVECVDHDIVVIWIDENGTNEKTLTQAEYDRVIDKTSPIDRVGLQTVLREIVQEERARREQRLT